MKLHKAIGFTGAAMLAVGAGGILSLAGSSAEAYANTPSFTLSCPGIPVAKTVNFGAVLDGASPSTVATGSPVTLGHLALNLTVPSNLVALGQEFKIGSLPLSFMVPIEVTDGSPTTVDETFTGSVTIPSTKGSSASAQLSATPASASVTASTLGSLSFSVPTTGVEFTVEGTIKSSCTVTSAETISSTTVTAPTPTAPTPTTAPAPTQLVTGPPQAPGGSPLLPIGIGIASLGAAGLVAIPAKRVLVRHHADRS